MPAAIKSVPIRDPDTDAVVGQYFEASDSFKSHVAAGQISLVRPDGKMVQVNRKLSTRGHYEDRGFQTPEQARMANARAAAAAKREEGAVK